MKIQSVELPVLDPETCRNMYSAYINLTIDHEFCAGYHMGNKGICPVRNVAYEQSIKASFYLV